MNIDHRDVKFAIECLLRNGAISKTGSAYSRVNEWLHSESQVPDSIIRSFHKQFLDLARAAIDKQKNEEREVHSAMIGIDPARLTEAKAWLQKAQRDFISEFTSTAKANRIYGIGTQLFKIDGGAT